jgi:5-methylcytosine-specific restriction endonuclease McrA
MNMTKLEQLTKELQALITTGSLDRIATDEIIEQKMRYAYYEGREDDSKEWVRRVDTISMRLKHHMPAEEQTRMERMHYFHDDSEECAYCGVSEMELDHWPQYCLTEDEKK